MSLIGIVQLNGVEQYRDDLEIGAFNNGVCRGRQLLSYYPQLDRYLVFLTIYGDEGDVINFKLFDHSLGQVSPLSCITSVDFTANGLIGSLTSPQPLNFLNMQQTEMAMGWTWYSSFVELDGAASLAMLESNLGEKGELIKSQDAFVIREGDSWDGTLTEIVNESMYLLKTNDETVLNMIGSFTTPSEHPITLLNGWSWIGYPSTQSVDLLTAISGLTPTDGDILKTQSSFALYSDTLGWVGTLKKLSPGDGLLYYSLGDTPKTFVFNGGRSAEVENITGDENHYSWNVRSYPFNMNVMAVAELDGLEQRNSELELAAFAEDGCRGSVRLQYLEALDRYIAFLTVSGEQATSLRWKLYDVAKGIAYESNDNVIVFEPNGVTGNLSTPYRVCFNTMNAINEELSTSLSLYPNPVKAHQPVTVAIETPTESKVIVEIVNALGAVVSSMTLQGSNREIKAPETPGLYFLKLSTEGRNPSISKLVVE